MALAEFHTHILKYHLEKARASSCRSRDFEIADIMAII